jgi:hypothetical protein
MQRECGGKVLAGGADGDRRRAREDHGREAALVGEIPAFLAIVETSCRQSPLLL